MACEREENSLTSQCFKLGLESVHVTHSEPDGCLGELMNMRGMIFFDLGILGSHCW